MKIHVLSLSLLLAGCSLAYPPPAAPTSIAMAVDPCAGLTPLTTPFDMKGTLLIGEFHGTEQAPAVVLNLICTASSSGQTVSLALEMPESAVGAAHGETATDAFWNSANPDGRSSTAMRKLLVDLKPLMDRGTVKAYGFYADPVGNTPAPVGSAERILKGARPGDLLMVYTGNMHARRPPEEGAPPSLASILPNVTNMNIANSKPGTVWACMPQCTTHNLGGNTGPLPLGFNAVPLRTGFSYFYVVETYTAAPPYRQD